MRRQTADEVWTTVAQLAQLLRVSRAEAAAIVPGDGVTLPAGLVARLRAAQLQRRPVRLALGDAGRLAGVATGWPRIQVWRWATEGRIGDAGTRVYLRTERVGGPHGLHFVAPADLAAFLKATTFATMRSRAA